MVVSMMALPPPLAAGPSVAGNRPVVTFTVWPLASRQAEVNVQGGPPRDIIFGMDLPALLDELQHIARNGLAYAADEYDRQRYTRLLELAAQSYGALTAAPAEAVRAAWLDELGHITPKIGADAAIFNEGGEILLMERADGSGWCLPCGWVEANERPLDAALREVREETGLSVRFRQLVGVFTRFASPENGAHTMAAVVHWCEVTGGELTLSPEGLALRYWPVEAVPRWHPNHQRYARAAHALWLAGGELPAVSD